MTASGYDLLAPHYRRYAERRRSYCAAVDAHIARWWPTHATAMLDVGSGDGGRAVQLARRLGATSVVLSDPSAPMCDLCREHTGVTVWNCAAESLSDRDGVFDVITCLWNVLGAIDEPERHLAALVSMRQRLAPAGRLFIDVHNRYNVATAGVSRVVPRRLRDWLLPSAANGRVEFDWNLEDHRIRAHGYLFSPVEFRRVCAAAQLRIEHEVYLDYDTGRRRGPWTGQQLLALTR